MAKWYVARNGKEEGPFDDIQLRKLAAEGLLSPSDLVRRDGSTTGSPAKKVKGLFTLPTSEKSVAVKRPPPPPGRVAAGMASTQSAAPTRAAQPPLLATAPLLSAAPAPAPASVAQKERRLNPNVTFVLGIWVGIGVCAAAFTGLAITGRFAPLVAWLEAAAQKEAKQEEQPKHESPIVAGQPEPAKDGGRNDNDGLSLDFLPVVVGKTKVYRQESFGLGGKIVFVVDSEETGQPDGAIRIKVSLGAKNPPALSA